MVIIEKKVQTLNGKLETIVCKHEGEHTGTIFAIPAIFSCAKRTYYVFRDLITPDNGLQLITFSFRGQADSPGLIYQESIREDMRTMFDYIKETESPEKPVVIATSCSTAAAAINYFKKTEATSIHVANPLIGFSTLISSEKSKFPVWFNWLKLFDKKRIRADFREVIERLPLKVHNHRYGYLYFNRIDKERVIKDRWKSFLSVRRSVKNKNIYVYLNEEDELLRLADPVIRKRYLSLLNNYLPNAKKIFLPGKHLWINGEVDENLAVIRQNIEESIRLYSR